MMKMMMMMMMMVVVVAAATTTMIVMMMVMVMMMMMMMVMMMISLCPLSQESSFNSVSIHKGLHCSPDLIPSSVLILINIALDPQIL